jgi:hypothetical protein
MHKHGSTTTVVHGSYRRTKEHDLLASLSASQIDGLHTIKKELIKDRKKLTMLIRDGQQRWY